MEELIIFGAVAFVLYTVIKAHRKATLAPVGIQPASAPLTTGETSPGVPLQSQPGSAIASSSDGGITSGSTSLTTAAMIPVVSTSPGVVATGNGTYATSAAIAYAASLPPAAVPAIGQRPSDSAQWSNLAQSDGTWLWQSIDGTNLVFAADVSGVRVR